MEDNRMDLPLNADVYCADGLCGRSVCLIVNPITKKVTHFVVQKKGFLHLEYMVPLSLVSESSPEKIHLRCKAEALAQLDSFEQMEFIKVDDPADLVMPPYPSELGAENIYLWPYVESENGAMGMYGEVEQIPYDEVGFHRGAQVQAKDGRIGQIDELVVDPVTSKITHLVLREGHLWGQKEITIPVAEIDHLEEDRVYLNLTKEQVEALPAVAVERWWQPH
jgi:uncharacterized protein YrrD